MKNALGSYEVMLLISSDLSEEDVKKEIGVVRELLTDSGGEVTFEDFWGRRKLAYPIAKQDFGYYHVMLFSAPKQSILNLEKELKLSKNILRHLVTIPPHDYKTITSTEVEVSERDYVEEMKAKKMKGVRRSPQRNEGMTKKSASASRTESEERPQDSKENLDKKINEILGDV